jgi:hypothetical protein
MKRRIHFGSIAVLFALTTLACSSDSNDDDGGGATSDAFVLDLIDNTADDTDPVAINGTTFSFSEDEGAFDDLFP